MGIIRATIEGTVTAIGNNTRLHPDSKRPKASAIVGVFYRRGGDLEDSVMWVVCTGIGEMAHEVAELRKGDRVRADGLLRLEGRDGQLSLLCSKVEHQENSESVNG